MHAVVGCYVWLSASFNSAAHLLTGGEERARNGGHSRGSTAHRSVYKYPWIVEFGVRAYRRRLGIGLWGLVEADTKTKQVVAVFRFWATVRPGCTCRGVSRTLWSSPHDLDMYSVGKLLRILWT